MKFPLNSKLPSGFKRELAATFVGTGWAGIIQLACIPAYIKLMGIESYGLVGFYLVLQAMLQVLDLGLSPTINREMARYSAHPGKADDARDLVRTLEVGYWLIGLLIAAGIIIASPWLSVHWIGASAIPVRKVMLVVMLMGMLAFFQWPVSFYQGGLMGLRQQVLMNTLKVVAVTLSNAGGVLILWRVSPTIQALLLWQVGIGALLVAALAVCFWRSLPESTRAARFDLTIARSVWRFAAGMTGIGVITLVMTQTDKLLVSKLFTLKTFGYYALAWSVANAPLIISSCVYGVAFPRFSALVSAEDTTGISLSYHRSAQLMAVLVLPIAAVLSLFSFEVLQLWTGNSGTAANTAPVLSVLLIGSAMNAMLCLPHMLQFAVGWTRLSFFSGVISIAILVPLMFPMTKHFGLVGAASVWAILNVLNMLIAVPIMHRRLLPRETWKYFSDFGLPLLGCIVTVTIGKLLFVFAKIESRLATLAVVASLWLVCSFVAILTAPHIRGRIQRSVAQPFVNV